METRTGEIPAAQVEITLAGWSPRVRKQTDPTQPMPHTRLPRVTGLMALAIKFQDMVERGDVRDYADLARLGYVTRARVTQIMNLLHLAADIQESILHLGATSQSAAAPSERNLRSMAQVIDWSRQRRLWREMTGALGVGAPSRRGSRT